MDLIKNAFNNKNTFILIMITIVTIIIVGLYVFRSTILETFTGKSHSDETKLKISMIVP